MIPTRALALIWTGVILVLHSLPRSRVERIPGGAVLVRSSGPDKIAHAAVFAVLGLLWSISFPRRLRTVLAAGIAYGVALELYQGWLIPGRTCSPVDALSDAAGMALGTAAAVGLRRWRRSLP